jgi:hypothetical protein
MQRGSERNRLVDGARTEPFPKGYLLRHTPLSAQASFGPEHDEEFARLDACSQRNDERPGGPDGALPTVRYEYLLRHGAAHESAEWPIFGPLRAYRLDPRLLASQTLPIPPTRATLCQKPEGSNEPSRSARPSPPTSAARCRQRIARRSLRGRRPCFAGGPTSVPVGRSFPGNGVRSDRGGRGLCRGGSSPSRRGRP